MKAHFTLYNGVQIQAEGPPAELAELLRFVAGFCPPPDIDHWRPRQRTVTVEEPAPEAPR